MSKEQFKEIYKPVYKEVYTNPYGEKETPPVVTPTKTDVTLTAGDFTVAIGGGVNPLSGTGWTATVAPSSTAGSVDITITPDSTHTINGKTSEVFTKVVPTARKRTAAKK